ncbi:MAG TPA: hypothetical protein VH583_20585 [Vicinamibacterales bacterium]|jgi:hypothetical protein
MVKVDWAFLCDLAYFDAYRNLCIPAGDFNEVRTELIGEHLLISIGHAAFLREGVYRFEASIGNPPATVDIPLLISSETSVLDSNRLVN